MASHSDIASILASTLNPDPNVRIQAELNLAELLNHPQNALTLAQLILAQEADISLRQHSASTLLTKYVKEHWSVFFPQFRGNPPSEELKSQIRAVVLQGLSDPVRKIRSLAAHVLSTIAKSDWPDDYPELLDSLIRLISSDSIDSIHGAMGVFAEFVQDELSEEQILPVLRELLPVLYSILGANDRHTPLTRSRTVSVFRQCVEALYMVKGHHPDAVKEATANILPSWLDAFKIVLGIDPRQDVSGDNWDGLALRIQIFRTLDTIHTSFPRAIAAYLPDFLSISLHHLQSLYPTFSQYYLVDSVPIPGSTEDEPVELHRLVAPIIDFVSNGGRSSKAKSWFDNDNLAALVDSLVRWAQITKENEEEWASDANLFVSQEDDDSQAYGIRIAVFDLLSSVIANESVRAVQSIDKSTSAVIAESNQARQAGDANWWRSLEAALAVIGSQSEPIIDCIDDEVESDRPKPINIEYLLSDVIPGLITLTEFPFLQGRSLVVASRYSQLLPTSVASQYLDAAVQVLESRETGVPFKISAVKALEQFCRNVDGAVITPIAPRMAKSLGPFLLETTEETLSLVLETLSSTVEVDKGQWITVDLANDLVLALLDVWTKNIKDPIFLSLLTDLFTSIASASQSVYDVTVKLALHRFNEAIANSDPTQSWITSSALDLLSALLQGAPESGIGEGFFATIASNVFKALEVAEDRDVLQNGISLLTLVVRKDVNQLLTWKDASDCTGLGHTLIVISKLVRSQDEAGGLVIGDLIIHLLRRAGGEVLPVLPELLWALISRMREAQTATFLQSLIIPFAFLINNQRDAVLDVIENITIADEPQRSALSILLNTWCENAGTFQGFWPIRISILALGQLILCNRPSVRAAIVKGDLIMRPETQNVIMTRSKTKAVPHEWTSVPFPVKAFKILLNELKSNGEASSMAALGKEVEEDDGGSDWEEEGGEEEVLKPDELGFLADMLGPGVKFDRDDLLVDNDDEELRNDPVAKIDLPVHILHFIKQYYADDAAGFQELVGQLNEEERAVVQRAVEAQ